MAGKYLCVDLRLFNIYRDVILKGESSVADVVHKWQEQYR